MEILSHAIIVGSPVEPVFARHQPGHDELASQRGRIPVEAQQNLVDLGLRVAPTPLEVLHQPPQDHVALAPQGERENWLVHGGVIRDP